MHFISRFLLLLFLALTYTSCQENENLTPTDGTDLITAAAIEEALANHFASNIDLSDAVPITIESPSGESNNYYSVDGDILISEKEFKQASTDQNGKQYHTTNLVTNCRIITIAANCDISGPSPDGIPLSLRVSLNWAVNQYNSHHRTVGIRFKMLPCDEYEEADIKVFFEQRLRYELFFDEDGNPLDVPAAAGFPDDNGNPFPHILVGPLLMDLYEHDETLARIAMTHEIGHTIGFRHTDWFLTTRCSELNPSPPEDPNYMNAGALHVPNTSSINNHRDWLSVMRACAIDIFNPNPTFTPMDLRALRYMYPKYDCRLVRPNEGGAGGEEGGGAPFGG